MATDLSDRLDRRDARSTPGTRSARAPSRGWFATWLRARTTRWRIITLILTLAVWEYAVSTFGRPFMPTPTGVASHFVDTIFRNSFMWNEARLTFSIVVAGLGISIVLGAVLGIGMGRVWWLESALAPYINGLYATPIIAILPVFTLWLGFSVETAFALVVFAALPPMTVGAWDGARSVSKRYLEVAETFGARRRDVWIGITIPASLAYMVSGLRLASGRALSAVVIAEFLTSTGRGIGTYAMRLVITFRHDEAVIVILVLAAAGLVLTIGVEKLASVLLPWYRNL